MKTSKKQQPITFGEYAAQFVLLYKEDRGIRTREMYDYLIEGHIDALKNTPLKKVTRDDIQTAINNCKDHPRTCQQLHSLISQVFENAVANGILKATPCVQITLPRYVRKSKRALTDDEIEAITTAPFSPLERAFIFTMYGTGMRPSELFALTWSDINFTANEIAITKSLHFKNGRPYEIGHPKTNASIRIIPTPKWCIDALRDYKSVWHLRRSAAIFNDDAGNYRTYAGYRNIFDCAIRHAFTHYIKSLPPSERAIKASSLNPSSVTPYIFRHNYCTLCRKYGVSVETCQRLMGHSTSRMVLDVYSHIDSHTEMANFASHFKL